MAVDMSRVEIMLAIQRSKSGPHRLAREEAIARNLFRDDVYDDLNKLRRDGYAKHVSRGKQSWCNGWVLTRKGKRELEIVNEHAN